MQRVAVDVEGVLADIHTPFAAEATEQWRDELQAAGYEEITPQDITDWETWGSKIQTIDKDWRDCLDITAAIWEDEWERIPPTEPAAQLRGHVAELHASYTTDIVTGAERPGSVKSWLAEHGFQRDVHYDTFRSAKDKTGLGYRVYIDDNPLMVSDLEPGQAQLLYDRPYNQEVEEMAQPYVRRVDDAAEATTTTHTLFSTE